MTLNDPLRRFQGDTIIIWPSL